MKLKLFTLVFGSLLMSVSAHGNIQFQNIDKKDLENVFTDLTGTYTHTAVAGTSSLGSIFGFELSLIAGQSTADNVNKLVKEADPNTTFGGSLYHGGFLGRVSVPFGITGELTYLPTLSGGGFEAGLTTLGIAVSLTDTVLSDLPVGLGLRAHYSTLAFSYKQLVSGVDTSVAVANTVTGAQVFVSKNFIFVEPYLGYGMVSSDGTVDIKGSGTFFDTTLTSGQSASATLTGSHLAMGAEFKLLLFRAGLEYAQILGVPRYSIKLGASF